jgi:endoglucanase
VRRLILLLLCSLLTSALPALPAEAAGANPFLGHRPVVERDRQVDRAVAASSGRTRTALSVIAAQPQARWYGGWISGARLTSDVASRTSRAHRAGVSSVLVAYALPHLDCGSAGLPASAYRRWIRSLAAGIRGTHVAVVLEPDALALLDCLPSAQRSERLALLRDAVGVLSSVRASVYLDAGHAGWKPVPVMAARLKAAGVTRARGASFNVSSFGRTADEAAYARAVAKAIPGLHAVVDTSRNGRGPAPDYAWCNPPGRGLGITPRVPRDSIIDAYLWIKPPGESDGDCGRREPSAGTFWVGYALGLVSRRA